MKTKQKVFPNYTSNLFNLVKLLVIKNLANKNTIIF
ncbi:hypothetical protein FLBR109950_03295 [Flavobacterium branchiophilum]|uniref:Uncharacterized protein n=1 Tax=Flavobacterium branchiophilum TaxID=55197 RepID=A0A543G032_9FLAO|nr:hypothetical protein BC670_0232 [Flavobacterium branchiophilum]